MPKLIINPGTQQAQEFALYEGENFFGSDATNHFQIEDVSVSGSHAQIVVNGNAAMVRDLGSTNGTFIDRSPVTESDIQSGQMLRFGGVELLFQGDAAATVTPAEVTVETPPPPSTMITLPSGGGLRIASSSPSTTATSSPPLPPRITPAAAQGRPAGNSICKIHAKSPARWECPRCGGCYCDLCVSSRRVADGSAGYFCRPCDVQCSPLEVTPEIHPLERGSFFSQLPGAFVYPFQNGGGFLLFCGTVFFVVVGFAKMFSFLLQVVFLGHLFAYMQNVINTTAMGDERKPDLPDVSNIYEDLLAPSFQLVATVILCFGPAFGFVAWGHMSGNQMLVLGFFPAIILGCLYFPMALLTVAMFDTVGAINPMLVVPAIFKVPLQYLVACVALGVVLGVRWVGDAILPLLIPVMIVPAVISSFVGLYFLTVQCRILGLLYFTNRERLGWFKF